MEPSRAKILNRASSKQSNCPHENKITTQFIDRSEPRAQQRSFCGGRSGLSGDLVVATSLCDVRRRPAGPWLQLPSASAAAENSSQDSANELPANLAAGSPHRALGH